jgi:hypothetical protein
MRKFLFILVLLTATLATKAQESYTVYLSQLYYDAHENIKNSTTSHLRIDVICADGTAHLLFFHDINDDNQSLHYWAMDAPITVYSRPVQVHTEGFVNFSSGTDAGYDEFTNIGICDVNHLDVDDNSPRMDGIWYDVKVTPILSINAPAPDKLLPDNDKITLTATSGFPASVYNWEYSLDGFNFNPFPAATNSAGKSTVNISLTDLVGTSSLGIIKKNTFIRNRTCSGLYTPSITLNNRLSSPHIVGQPAVTPNKCFGESNGSVKIQFDRALLPGELFNIFVDDVRGTTIGYHNSQINVTQLQTGNTWTWPEEIPPGSYKISLVGKYPDASVSTYTSAPTHVASFKFLGPTAITYSTTKRDVYCHNGSDATITINASGGNGNYTVGYKKVQETTYTWVPFAAANTHTLTGLDTGSYNIRIKDIKNCIMKIASGGEVIGTVIINQPADALHVDNAQPINPLAFGYTDGSIRAILTGGTPVGGASYNLQWTTESGTVLTPEAATTNPFTTLLKNIGNGKYILVATDANYALTSGANTKGCITKDTFTLVEPPPLIVTVSEYRYVSCKNASDGKLVAKAQGGIEIPIFRYKYKWFRNDTGVWTDIQQTDSIAIKLKAGEYKIIITDKNNIDKESAPFILVEPTLLTLAVNSTPLNCNGSNNGTASAVINGGTLPYHLEWTTGETTSTISNLAQGNYKAFVTDARNCQVEQQVKVTSPNPVQINNVLVKSPTCYKGTDGVISYSATGGTLPYTYNWSNGTIAATQSNLPAGDYKLTLIDSKNCPLVQTFTVKETPPVTINLPQAMTLCTGQVYEADATIPKGFTYQWTGPNGYYVPEPKAKLSNEGTYNIIAANTDGCIGKNAITITRSNAAVAAAMLVSTQAFTNEAVTIVNISDPAPEKVQWLLPNKNVSIVSTSEEAVQVKFTDTGRYIIGMRTMVGACEKTVSQPITIVQAQQFDEPGAANTPFVKEFTVGPNPSSGQFTVKIGLEDAATIKLRLIDLNTGAVVHQQQQSGSKQYQLPYNLRLTTGVYSLILETAKEYRIIKVMIL